MMHYKVSRPEEKAALYGLTAYTSVCLAIWQQGDQAVVAVDKYSFHHPLLSLLVLGCPCQFSVRMLPIAPQMKN